MLLVTGHALLSLDLLIQTLAFISYDVALCLGQLFLVIAGAGLNFALFVLDFVGLEMSIDYKKNLLDLFRARASVAGVIFFLTAHLYISELLIILGLLVCGR